MQQIIETVKTIGFAGLVFVLALYAIALVASAAEMHEVANKSWDLLNAIVFGPFG